MGLLRADWTGNRWLSPPGKARLFLDLAQGDRPRIGLSLPVPARLQPAIEAGVVEEEDVLVGGVEHEIPTR